MAVNNIYKYAGPIRVGILASDPATAENGMVYYNSTDNAFKMYASGSWQPLAGTEFLTSLFRIDDSTDSTKKIAFDASGITTATTRTITMPDANVNLGLVSTALQTSQLGANSGVASLDSSGKIPTAQLPALAITSVSVVTDNTARDALTVQEGDVAVVTSTGKTFIYDGAAWVEITASGAVTSVNGQTGTVSLNSDNISEGSTNLYFTNARAQSATIAQAITSGVTDKAPSEDVVFNALALKLSSVQGDTTPVLGGDLDINSKALKGPIKRSEAASAANYVQEEYIHAITLTGSASATVASALTFAHGTFASVEISYQIKDTFNSRYRKGILEVTTDGTNIGITDRYTETGDVGVTWDAAINVSNLELKYTTTANNKTMRADVKRFLV